MTPKELAEQGRRIFEGAKGRPLVPALPDITRWAMDMIRSVERYSVDPLDLQALSDARAEVERLRRELQRLKECAGTDPVTLIKEIDRILAGGTR